MVDLVTVGGILLAFVLVVLNGLFVAAEFAFVRIRSTAVDSFVAEGRAGAETLQNVMQNLDDYLAVSQLGITLSSLGLGWIGEPAVAAVIEPVLGSLLPTGVVHLVAFALGFGFITFLHVVFGELAPKTVAIAEAERAALALAPPMTAFYYLFVPGIVVFNGTANFITSLVGIEPASESEETLSEEEILMVLGHSGREGHVGTEEVEMIERVFALDDTTVREVMVPRPDVVSVSADLPLADLRSQIVTAGHTRYPVLESDDAEAVVGFVDAKDVLAAFETGGDPDGVVAGDLARDLPVVPETGRLDDLLAAFQTEHVQIAAVIDEWGGFEGLVTVEDVVEALVGDLRDDFDVAAREPSIERVGEGTYAVDGGVAVATVNEELDAAFVVEDFATMGGFVLDRLGRAPEVGDRIEADGYALVVEGVDGARASKIVVREANAAPDGE